MMTQSKNLSGYRDDNECPRYFLFPSNIKGFRGREGQAKIFSSPTKVPQPWDAKEGYYFWQ